MMQLLNVQDIVQQNYKEKKLAKKKKTYDEQKILTELNSMDEADLKKFRRENAEHDAKIAKRTFRNFISGTIKRFIDILAGVVGTILLIPITIIVWCVKTKNRDNGPLFYEQLRIGRYGKVFRLYKFRTMVIGAEDLLNDYLKTHPEEAKEYEINKKLQNDPRITKTGEFLRRTSLDEWPQFINILFGQMSLVGPRPYLPSEKQDMGEYYKYIVQMRPGLTGPWQVAGRNEISFKNRLKLDEEYCSRRGNRRDFVILIKTFKKVFRKQGAL